MGKCIVCLPSPLRSRLPQGNRGCPVCGAAPLNTAIEMERPGLGLAAGMPTPCTHLRLIAASPARACWLVGAWVEKGLHGWGLREAGLEQEDRREDWLSACVLTEPCGDRTVKSGLPIPRDLFLRPPLTSECWGYRLKAPSYLETCGQHLHGAFPVGLPRRGSPGPEEDREGSVTGVLKACLAGRDWRFQLPHTRFSRRVKCPKHSDSGLSTFNLAKFKTSNYCHQSPLLLKDSLAPKSRKE